MEWVLANTTPPTPARHSARYRPARPQGPGPAGGTGAEAREIHETLLNLVARGLIKNPDKHLRRFVTFTSPAGQEVTALGK